MKYAFVRANREEFHVTADVPSVTGQPQWVLRLAGA